MAASLSKHAIVRFFWQGVLCVAGLCTSLPVYALSPPLYTPDASPVLRTLHNWWLMGWVYPLAALLLLLGTGIAILRYLRIARALQREAEARQSVQAQLHARETQYRLIAEHTGDTIWMLDIRSLQFTFVSPSVQKLTGYTVVEVMNTPIRNLVSEAALPSILVMVRDLLARKLPEGETQARSVQTNELIHQSGAIIPVETMATVIADAEGIPQSILGVTRDITENKRVEMALRESEARYRQLVESSTEQIVVHQDGKIVFANAAAGRIFGDGLASNLLGRAVLDFVHEADRPAVIERIGQMQRKGGMVPLIEERYLRPDGSIIDMEVAACATVFGGRPAFLVVGRDISDRKRTEKRERWRNLVLELLAKGAPLSAILEAVVRGVEAENAGFRSAIFVMEASTQTLSLGAAPSLPAAYWQAVQGMPIGPGMGSSGTVAFTNQRLIVADIQQHPYWDDYRVLASQLGLAACWAEPIRFSTGALLGTFAIYHNEVKSPCEDDLHLLEQAANLAGIAIERYRNEEELKLASMVYEHSAEGMVVTDENNTIIAINPAYTKITGYGEDEVIGKKPKILNAGRQDAESVANMWRHIAQQGHWQGELWNRRKNGEEFAEWITINTIRNQDGSVHRHVALFSDITERKRADELIWRQANFDLLTSLPNRRYFRDRLDQELIRAGRSQQPVALCFIDLDQFKVVNDTLGHDVGDSLLIEAARRIRDSVRESDTVARLGGDEFTLIFPGVSALAVEPLVQKILRRLAEPFNLGNDVAYVSASIGVTLFPEDAQTPEGLLKNADQAMYVAKSEGRNRFSFFTPSMQEIAQSKLYLSNDLRGAMAGGQLEVHFQPIIELATGQILKAEALLRWFHPQRGMVSPAEFIPLAEESGLINEIGDWVFKQSVQWAQRWSELIGTPFQISVNKSPVQFIAQAQKTDWAEYLAERGVSGACLSVEITEGLLLYASSTVNEQLLQCKRAGIAVSIDDFGTGYSSMAYLKQFHIDYLKIDQSFVRDMTSDPSDRAIAEAIIVMAHKLGYRVIAEGIETPAQRDLLLAAGCDFGQGYLFSRAITPQHLEAMLIEGKHFPP